MQIYMQVCMCARRGQRTISGVSPQKPFTLFSETCSLSDLELNKRARLAGHQALVSTCLCPYSTRVTSVHHHAGLFFFNVGPRVSNSCLMLAPAFCQLSHLPCPHLHLLKSSRKERNPIICKNAGESYAKWQHQAQRSDSIVLLCDWSLKPPDSFKWSEKWRWQRTAVLA